MIPPDLLQHVLDAGHVRVAAAGDRPLHGVERGGARARHRLRRTRAGKVCGWTIRKPVRAGHHQGRGDGWVTISF